MRSVRLTWLVLMLLVPCLVQAETRIALVIGNSTYRSGSLPNPANDAKLIGAALRHLGFDVIEHDNADQVTMKRAIEEFGARLEKAGPDSVGLFYYAGHGLQLSGRNYLIPTTANIEREGDVEIEAVSADWVIEQMRYARNRLNIVILDACRNNPFSRGMRSADHGLAMMDAPAGILIAYSTAPGEVAQDGSGRNSPYTQALTQAMQDVHEPVEQVFKHVRVGVMTATAGKQVPWESSSLTGDFYFTSAPRVAANSDTQPGSVAVTPRLEQQPAPATTEVAATGAGEKPSSGGFVAWVAGLFSTGKSASLDASHGNAVATGASPSAMGVSTVAGAAGSAPRPGAQPTTAGMRVASSSATVTDAGMPADGLGVVAPSSGPTIQASRALPILSSLGIESNEIHPGHSYPLSAIRLLVQNAPRHATLGSTPEQIRAAYALCQRYSADCQIGWYADESMREATLNPFDLDPAPVSVRAFRRFAEATHYRTQAEKVGYAYAVVNGSLQAVPGGNWRNAIKEHAAEDDSPVVGVSFQDAQAYCRSKGERLPSEDEWEYAARGPKRTMFPWGDDATPVARGLGIPPHVNDGPAEGIGGRYKGLSGNVWQWVDTRVGSRAVLKGGSWLESNPANKRGATRRYEIPSRADEDSGFRCAKSVSAWPDASLWLSQIT